MLSKFYQHFLLILGSQSGNPGKDLESLAREVLQDAVEITKGEGISHSPSYRRNSQTSLEGGVLKEIGKSRLYEQAQVDIDTNKYTATLKANVYYDEEKKKFDYADIDNSLEIVKFVPKEFSGKRVGKFTDNSAKGVAKIGESNLSGTESFIKTLAEQNPKQVQTDYVQTLRQLKEFYTSLKQK